MKLPSVYPLTNPSSHNTSKITAIVNSISASSRVFQSTGRAAFICHHLPTSHRISCMKYGFRFGVFLVLLILLSSSAAPQAQMDTSLFAGLRWRSIGPSRGGRSQTAAGSVVRPLEYYFGATGG